jgi:hypothetical protein
MKNLILTISLLSGMFLTGCAQTRRPVLFGGAFYRVQHPGNLPVDEQGNVLRKSDTVRVIYLITHDLVADTPKIQRVQYGNRMFSSSVFLESYEQAVVVGKRKESESDFIFPAAKNRRYWVLQVTPLDKIVTAKKNIITVTGTFRGRKFTFNLVNEVELEPELRL